MRPAIGLVTALALAGLPLRAEIIHFCWIGSDGWSMSGQMELQDEFLRLPVVTEKHVTAFEITGYRDGTVAGTWSLAELTPGASWHLRFDPAARTFRTGGLSSGEFGQEWNADGDARNCGTPGFGFNSGSLQQDICLNGKWIRESGVPPGTPFPVSDRPFAEGCRPADGIS